MPSLRQKSLCSVSVQWFMKSRMTNDFLELHLPAHDMEKKIEGRKILNFNVINVIYFEVRKSLFLSP